MYNYKQGNTSKYKLLIELYSLITAKVLDNVAK